MSPPRRTRRTALIATLIVVMVVVSVLVAVRLTARDPLKHETVNWAVIEDNRGGRMAVEASNLTIWAKLIEMHTNASRLWVGGTVVRYDNAWGFRFDPGSIGIAQVTAEAFQSTLEGISADLDYWIGLGRAYVFAGVVSIHTM